MPRFQPFFRVLPHFLLAKLASSSIWVKNTTCPCEKLARELKIELGLRISVKYFQKDAFIIILSLT